MKEIALTNGFKALVDDEDYDFLMKWKWFYNSGYAVARNKNTGIEVECKSQKIKMHRLLMNFPKGFDIDHKNRNTLDNRRSNLRMCTRSQNVMNSKVRSDNKSGYKGVYKRSDREKWRSVICSNGVYVNLGCFDTPEDARDAYIKAMNIYHGEFGRIE